MPRRGLEFWPNNSNRLFHRMTKFQDRLSLVGNLVQKYGWLFSCCWNHKNNWTKKQLFDISLWKTVVGMCVAHDLFLSLFHVPSQQRLQESSWNMLHESSWNMVWVEMGVILGCYIPWYRASVKFIQCPNIKQKLLRTQVAGMFHTNM